MISVFVGFDFRGKKGVCLCVSYSLACKADVFVVVGKKREKNHSENIFDQLFLGSFS